MLNLKEHWDKTYLKIPEEKLGWYETDLSPTLNLLAKASLDQNSRILNVGAGSTTLIDELINLGYLNLIATDLSEVALSKLNKRLPHAQIEFIRDDITNPIDLNQMSPVDLWIDRAVLHFFTMESDQDAYFKLLKEKVNCKGYVFFAEFNLDGATQCSRLPVKRYNLEMLADKLGSDFDLIDSFNHTYIMPSGAARPYVYALFKKK